MLLLLSLVIMKNGLESLVRKFILPLQGAVLASSRTLREAVHLTRGENLCLS
jgi:hypothetical protein